jgi:hypothetical protein
LLAQSADDVITAQLWMTDPIATHKMATPP